MNLFELFVKIDADTSQAEKGMKDTQKNSETLTNKIKVMSAQFEAAQKNVDKLTQEFNESVNKTGAASEETQELAKKLNDAEKEAEIAKKALDGYNSELGETETKTKNAGDSVESLSDKLKKGLSTAAKVATGVLTTVASGVVALGKIGLEYNAQIESYTTDFEVMMGDAEAAARKVEELKEMGAKTPFELGDLASATKTLLAFNVSADDSTGVLQQLGDISLGNVQKLESLTLAYGKMNASQKVTLEDINMMIDAGFNPLLLVAENTGETMEEVYDRISKGGVAFEEISGAINQATSEGGQFYQGMDKASQTTQGLISTLKDAAQSKIGELFSSISEKIKELLPNVISFVENIDTDEIVTGVENLMQTFNDLLPVITGVTAATVAYKAATYIAGIIDALRKATEAQTIAQALLNAVMNANPFVLVATLIAGLVAAVITLWNTNEDFREAVIEIWGKIKDAFSTAWDFITTLWESAGEFFSGIWEDIKGAFAAVGDWFSKTFKEGKEKANEAWSNAKELFGKVWEKTKEAFSDVANWFGDRFKEGKENANNAWNNAKQLFSNHWENVKSVFSNVGGWFTEKFTDAKNRASGAWSNAKSIFSTVWANVKSGFNISDAFTWGRDMLQNFINGIKAMWNSLKQTVSAMAQTVRDFLGFSEPKKGPLSNFHTYAPDMMNLFIKGIKDNEKRLTDQIEKTFDFGEKTVNARISYDGHGNDQIYANGKYGRSVSIVQNIYSEAKTAADLMQEAIYQQERAVLLGV